MTEQVVMEGQHADLRWQIRVAEDGQGLMTMLHVHRGTDLLAASGFGGPALYPGQLVNEWRGRTDGLPYFVLVRTHVSVSAVRAVTDRGVEVSVPLSPVLPDYQLRFGAAALPVGHAPGRLRVETPSGIEG